MGEKVLCSAATLKVKMYGIIRNARNSRPLLKYAQSQTLQQESRAMMSAKFNSVICFVPQQEAWVIERMGKFHRILEPGLNLILPVIDSIKYIQILKEIAIDIPQQRAITADNVTLSIDGILYVKVEEPYKTSYGVEDAQYAIKQLAQTTMRSELGKIQLDVVFKEREVLNYAIVESINKAAEAWGLKCLRYEIRDIGLPDRVQDAMQMQVEAERKKRATILESEGIKEAEINVAEGRKQSRILTSEAYLTEQINQADGEAKAILATANAKAEAIQVIGESLSKENGHNAVSVTVAEKYIGAFSNLAKEGNTVLLPTNTGDMSGMVAQAMSIYRNLSTDDVKKDLNIRSLPTTAPRDDQAPH